MPFPEGEDVAMKFLALVKNKELLIWMPNSKFELLPEESIVPLKLTESLDTKGLEFVAKIPLSRPLAALFIASLMLSTDTSFFVTKVKSINETFGVGTLIAVPSNLPFKLGKTKLIALAAPVDVGDARVAHADSDGADGRGQGDVGGRHQRDPVRALLLKGVFVERAA